MSCLPADWAAGLTSSNATDLSLAPLVAGAIDDRFTVDVVVVDDRLPGLSTYMNIVNVLVEQAQLGFAGTLAQEPPQWTLPPPYDNVKVQLTSTNGQRIERRFLVWGLYQAACYFANHGFLWTAFGLKWEGAKQAALIFESIERPKTTTRGRALAAPTGISNLPETNNTSLGAPRVSIDLDYLAQGKSLKLQGVFVSIGAVLVELASRPINVKLTPFTSADKVARIHFGFDYEKVRRDSPRVTNSQAAVAVWQIANWIVDRRIFAELSGSINVNGRYAVGFLMLDFDTPVPAPHWSDNAGFRPTLQVGNSTATS